MPRHWYDYHANKLSENPTKEDIDKRELNLRILAEKKPYFMCYIYPALMTEYNTYIRNTNVKCLREFRLELPELLAMPAEDRTEKQNDFVRYYESRMPVSINNCVMNRICRRFEQEFDGFIKQKVSGENFDCSILKSESEYTKTQYYAVVSLYEQYTERLRVYRQAQKKAKFDESVLDNRESLERIFAEETAKVCSNAEQLCNIVIDLCYSKAGTKQFAWDICGETILLNLLRRNDFMISFPVLDPEGNITYCGQRFSMKQKRSGKYDRDCAE